MPQGKGTYGSKKGRPPKKMNRGGMTPAQKSAFFKGPKKSGIAEIQEGDLKQDQVKRKCS